MKAQLLQMLRVAKAAGEALSVTDMMEMKLPDSGLIARALAGGLHAPTLEALVEEGTVTKAISDGVPYYWLADESAGDG
jgi:hypothetical protein